MPQRARARPAFTLRVRALVPWNRAAARARRGANAPSAWPRLDGAAVTLAALVVSENLVGLVDDFVNDVELALEIDRSRRQYAPRIELALELRIGAPNVVPRCAPAD